MRELFLTGSTGRLGRSLQNRLDESWIIHPCSRSRGDDLAEALPKQIIPNGADFVVNCAAVSSRMDCVSDPLSAFAMNSRWPGELAEFCQRENRRLVHISTDLVYSGGIPPYTESSPAVPRSLYGWTKLLGDIAVLRRDPRALVVRTSVLTGIVGAVRPTFTEDILQGRATSFHVDCFRNHTDIRLLAAFLEGAILSSLSGLVLAAAPHSMSRAAYAYSILSKDIRMIPAPDDIPHDLTLKPSVNLTGDSSA